MFNTPFFVKHQADIMQRADEIAANILTNLNKGYTPVEVMDEIYKLHNQLRQANQIDQHTSCGRGCNFCCHDEIMMSQLEAEHFKAKALPVAKINTKHLKKQVAATGDFDNQLKFVERACPMLLPNGDCSVYDQRPLICRTHNSNDEPILCKHEKGVPRKPHGQLYTVEEQALALALCFFILDDGKRQVPKHHKIDEAINTVHQLAEQYLKQPAK